MEHPMRLQIFSELLVKILVLFPKHLYITSVYFSMKMCFYVRACDL